MEQKSIAFIIFGIFGFLTSSFTRFRNYTYNGNINYLKNNTDIDDERIWLNDNIYNGNFSGKFIEILPVDKYKNN